MTVVSGIVNPISNISIADGTLSNAFLQGKAGELITSELRGKYFTAAYRGQVFTTSVPAASTLTIPTTLASLASKYCLVNPAGSGKVMELIRTDFYIASATEVVNVLGWTKSTLVTAGLGTLTAGVINSTLLNGPAQTNVGVFYTAATHTDTPVWCKSLVGVNATAVGLFVDSFIYDGTFLLYPGNCIDLVASTGAQANSLVDTVWAEFPI